MVEAEDVAWCYRLFLGREPESSAVIAQHCGADDLKQLVERIYHSDEAAQLRSRNERRQLKANVPRDESSPQVNEIFRGYRPEDRDRIAALVVAPAEPVEGFYVDCFGQRFSPAYHPVIADRVGQVSNALPLPGDRHLSAGVEYAAAALAFEMARGRSSFAAVELGAGFGPWTALFGRTAVKLGFQEAHLAAFEADAGRYAQLRSHLDYNGVVPLQAATRGSDSRLHWRLFNAAAWWRDDSVWWPTGGDTRDAGMRAEANGESTTDYRGHTQTLTPIPALDIESALDGMPLIDIVHIDLQGSEADLIPRWLPFLSRRVRSMFIGTHSRKIEGDLISLLYSEGWVLLREKPCRFKPAIACATLDARTTDDGAQYWLNPAVATVAG